MTDVVVFAGPSAHGMPDAVRRPDGATILPPARRGDIDRLTDQRSEPAVIVLCDGVFHSSPAVSHAELCRALDAGWDVWGVSSIGAIRAYELRDHGMRGFGYVHALFSLHPTLTDDEMCVLHFPDPPYFPVTEALVNLRFAFETFAPSLGIPPASCQRVIDELQRLWFGDRTVERIRAVLRDAGGVDAQTSERLLSWLALNRAKTIDLTRILLERPWRH